MVALLREESIPQNRTEPMPSLAPRLRLVPTDQSPLRLDLETPADITELFEQRRDTTVEDRALVGPGRSVHASAPAPARAVDTDAYVDNRALGPIVDIRSEHYQPAVTPMLAALTALLILALLTFVRISQGAPPASSWDSLAPTPAAATAPGVGEIVRIVDVGDTLWAIAAEIAPDMDRRTAVDALANRNGGSGLQVGQRLVIPAQLVRS